MKTALLFGGASEERLVALASAQNLISQYSFDEHIFWSPHGELFLEDSQRVREWPNPFREAYIPSGTKLAEALDSEQGIGSLKASTVFLCLHGGDAENGSLQIILEKNKILFTGSGAASSKIAFDKTLSKNAVQSKGGRVPQGIEFDTKLSDWQLRVEEFFLKVGALVIKPRSSGSSFGLYFVEDPKSLKEAFHQISNSGYGFSDYLAEEWVRGRELTVGWVEGYPDKSKSRALPPSEIILEHNRHFDYEGKYLGKGVQEITPADLTHSEVLAAQKLADLAHQAVGAYGYSRTDMILTPQGEMVFLEINTLPGMSGASFIPQQLSAAGLSLESFIDGQLQLASKRCQALFRDAKGHE